MRNKRPKQHRVRRFPFGITVLLLLCVYAATMLFWPMQAITGTVAAQSNTLSGTPPTIRWPAYGQSALGTADSGILATSGSQTPAPMASITKLVTTLTVLETKPLAAG